MTKVLVNLDISTPITPQDLSKIDISFDTPTVAAITGRGPIWLYAYLTHLLHTTVALFVFDPRLGYVCVSTHHPDYKLGNVLPDFAPDKTIDITF